MIVFPILGIHGRLGNQMFELAAVIALAAHRNTVPKIPKDLAQRETHGQKCLLKNLKLTLEEYDESELNSSLFEYHQPGDNNMVYYPEFWSLPANSKIYGHFESELYFLPYRDKVLEQFQFPDELEQEAKEYIARLKAQVGEDKEIVALHFRLGDAHNVRSNLVWYIYYIETVKERYFKDPKYRFLVFTGGSREQGNSNKDDIELCKQILPNSESYFFCELDDTLKEMVLMKNCNHLLMTMRSTFGWWAGYLNQSSGRKVICPRRVVGYEYNPDLLWPSCFTQVDLFEKA